MGCCCSSIDPEDPTVTAYVRTTQYLQYRDRIVSYRYSCPCPKLVYVQGDSLHFQCWCFPFPLRNISSVYVARGDRNQCYSGRRIYLDHGVIVKGNEGTVIAFSTSEGETERFVQQLKSAVEESKMAVYGKDRDGPLQS